MGIIVPNYKNKSNKNSGEKYRTVRLNSCPESNKYVLLEQYDHLGRWALVIPEFSSLRSILLPLLGPVVQSIVSLTSSLVVKILTFLVSTISNS